MAGFHLQESGHSLVVSLKAEVFERTRCGGLGKRLAALELLERHLYGLVELLILTRLLADRVVVYKYVGIHSVILHDPLPGLLSLIHI